MLLSFDRFKHANHLQAVEITIMSESNRLSLMQKMHDQFASNHSKMNKTIKLLKRNHRWSEMIRDVKQYVRNCHTCRRAKVAKNKYHELLNSLSILDRSWTDITFDFVTDLFDNREYNAILMIVDRLSKMHHYISCIIDENDTTIEETIKLLIQHVWKLHELLTTMISNRDSQFIFFVWNTICRMLRIKAKLFIAFHSETNEQSEIFNQKMKRYLRAYVNHQQDDWADWLSMTEYASNAFISVTTQMFSFLANYEFESRMSFDQIEFDENTTRERVNRFRSKEIIFTMKNIWKFAKEHMKKNQIDQAKYANKHKTIASNYQIEDRVWLFIKNIQIDRSSRKLNHKMLESFKILKKRESSYKLHFSNEINLHSIFHISLLRKNFENSLSEQIISSSSSVMIDDEQKFDVEDIVDFRLINRASNKRLQYKVRWVEHFSDRKWYSAKNFDHAIKIVVDYHHRYSNKSSSHSIIVSLIINRIMRVNWIKRDMNDAQNLIQKILNRMKKEMNSTIKYSIFSVDRNVTNVKTASQDSFVIKTTSVERTLFNQKKEKKVVSRSRVIHSVKWSVSWRISKRD
jgi:hypothetical protein